MDYWSLVEPHWSRVRLDDADSFLTDYAAMPGAARNLFCAHWLYSEVCNGGFHQFFANSTGVLAPEAVSGLHALGLIDLAVVATEAIGFFPTPYPRNQVARIALLDAYARQSAAPAADDDEDDEEAWNPFGELDDRFYETLQTGQFGEDQFVQAANAYAARN